MPLNPGYYYIVIDTFTLPTNPTRNDPFIAEKLSVDITTLSKSVTQHFDMDITDQKAHYEWDNLDTTSKDTLKTLYSASYVEYDFYDEKNNHYLVVINNFTAKRRQMLDEDGWVVTMDLKRVG